MLIKQVRRLTYNTINVKDVWCVFGPSGQDKCQCTGQFMVFTEGIPRMKPLVIFCGKGLRMSKQEKTQWDKRVCVSFQPNAWCDQQVMKDWIQNDCNNVFCNPATPGSSGKLLLADIHRAQQTPEVKTMLATC